MTEPDPKQPDIEEQPDTKELDALLNSLNGSAERFQTLWFSFLGLTLYLAIAALATTHRNLLLGEPQTLPIVNIKVELLPFYVIAPLLYLVFHFYLLMMLVLLARTVAPFETELKRSIPDPDDQERYRAKVGNSLFLQILSGMKLERAGFNGVLLGMIALITIVLFPLGTLVLTQMMFLPYHHLAITWWHRALVIADLVLIIVMWRRFFAYSGVKTLPFEIFPNRHWLQAALPLFAYLGLFVVVGWLSFWEGRWAGEPLIGGTDFAATEKGIIFGLFPDRLKLPNELIVGKEKLDKTNEEIASRGGDFVPTINLDGRDLQAADLVGADLRGVKLTDAVVRGARLEYTQLDDADLIRVQLQDSNLFNARMRGADLSSAQLQGANLQQAQLQGANLSAGGAAGRRYSAGGITGRQLSAGAVPGGRPRIRV